MADLLAARDRAWVAYSRFCERNAANPDGDEAAALARDTHMYVDHTPSLAELRSVSSPPGPSGCPPGYTAWSGRCVPPQDALMGIYYIDPARNVRPTIVLFADNIAAQGVPVADVVVHELAHRVGRDHSLRAAAEGSVVDEGGNLVSVGGHDAGIPDVGSGASIWTSGCPVCLLHDRTAVARDLARGIAATPALARLPAQDTWTAGAPWWSIHDDCAIADALADGLAFQTASWHRILPGLGGTVPGIRAHLERAAVTAASLDGQVPAPTLDALQTAIDAARAAWAGTATVDTVGAASATTTAAWWQAWEICAAVAGGQAAPRLRHALAEAQGMCHLAAGITDVKAASLAIADASRECAGSVPACSSGAERAWWAAYTTAQTYFARGRR